MLVWKEGVHKPAGITGKSHSAFGNDFLWPIGAQEKMSDPFVPVYGVSDLVPSGRLYSDFGPGNRKDNPLSRISQEELTRPIRHAGVPQPAPQFAFDTVQSPQQTHGADHCPAVSFILFLQFA